MTTSGVSSFSVTRDEIFLMAFEDMAVYALDMMEPTPSDMARANRRLNMIAKGWQGRSLGLWLNKIGTLTLTANKQSYNLGPGGDLVITKPLSILEARRVDTDGNELLMTPMSRMEYMQLPLKSSSGEVTQYYYDRQLTTGTLYVWPIEADLTAVIKFTYRAVIEDFVDIDNTPDFPQEWYSALHWNLALELCPAYQVPPQRRNEIKEMAVMWLEAAAGFDREQETSVSFAPDFT